ncbi:DUF4190 domain-containing protein [Mycobacterium saskatchewanense]|uniref:DUF4190 domain-containing protein n=1 Tax=Mycobacterium saskatchewanense TaxID=220927 RepID=UPI00114D5B93|nr:DUF4190 domain-containing protein [Mycobacterium saskatchewanense]
MTGLRDSPPSSPRLGIISLGLAVVAVVVFWSVWGVAVAHAANVADVAIVVAAAASVVLGGGAVATGAVARRRLRRGPAGNGGIALAGVVLGFLAVVLPGLLLIYLAFLAYSGYQGFESCVRGAGASYPSYMCLKECPPFLDSLCRSQVRW